MNIKIETWQGFLFDLWKWIKKYWSNETDNYEEAIRAADTIMKKYDRHLFNAIMFGCLEQKSFESIHGPSATNDEIEKMNSVHFPLVK